MTAPVIALAGLLGLTGCSGFSFGCPTGDVTAYQACQARQQVEQTDWGTEFRRRDYNPGGVPPPTPTSPGGLADEPVQLDEPAPR